MMAADKVAEDLRDAHEAVAGERSPIARFRPRCAGWSGAARRRRR